MNVNVDNTGDYVVLTSPYHPDLPSSAKAIGGRWSGYAWYFDARDEERVRSLAKDIYGFGEPTVTIRYVVDNRECSGKQLFKFGRLIAERRGRDSQVRLGDGVIIVEGKFPSSAGSSKYPAIASHTTKVVLEIRDVPVNLIDVDDPKIQVIGEMPEENPLASFSDEQLLAEIKRRELV